MTLQGFEVRSAKAKGERSSDEEEPDRQPIRPAQHSPAERRNLTNEERTVKRRRRRVSAAYSQPGYYLVDKDGTPQSGRFDTLSEAEAQLQPESGQLMQYLDQAPNSSHVAEPWPPNLNQVNGSLSMSAHLDDEFLFVAGMGGEEADADEDEGAQNAKDQDLIAQGALSDDRINAAYERHLQWARENGHDNPDTVEALRAHERAGGLTRAEANGVADQQYIGGGEANWRSHKEGAYTPEEEEENEEIRQANEERRQPAPYEISSWQKKESLHVREGQLLAAMAKAHGDEQRQIMGELEGLRRQARRRVIADREIDLADAYIHDSLTPVRVHEHHTAATDWISDVAEPGYDATSVHQATVVEAQRWMSRVSMAVKEDRDEYLEQARGVARQYASAQGPHRDLAFQTFMRTAADGESGALPWSAPPMALPPTGGGNAPFGVPQGGAPLNGQNFNPMATEVYPGSQPLPLDNGASAWPPAENLEGEEPLPPVAPDNYNAVGADTHMSALQREADAKEYSPRSGMGGRGPEKPWKATHTYNPIGWDAFDARPHPGSKAITPGVPIMNHGYMSPRGPGGMRLVHVSDEAGNHQTIDSRSLGEYDPDPGRANIFESRRQASEAFNGPKQTYQDYLARLSEGSEPMDQEHWAGSMSAVSPAPSNVVTPVTAMFRWAERGTDPDPQGNDLAGNPMAGYPEGGNWDKDEAHAQSGEAQSNLPLAPEGPEVTQHLDFLTDFPDTGPTEVPSDRAANISANGAHTGATTETPYDFDPGYTDEGAWGDTSDRYMSEIPHDFEPQGNSQYCRTCGESRRHPMHVYARRMTAADKDKSFNPAEEAREDYATTPGGQAATTEQYEQAYSSGRNIDYSETGIGQLGTVPVQGYGANPNGEMFTWQMAPGGVPVGAANVADVPPPGAGQVGASQPTDLNGPESPEGKEARLERVRSMVRQRMGTQI
jgi:hypothetical protein